MPMYLMVTLAVAIGLKTFIGCDYLEIVCIGE